jgi:uncharacterized membrane protein YbhN (UPF0104 family)
VTTEPLPPFEQKMQHVNTWGRWLRGRRRPLTVVLGSVAVSLGVAAGLGVVAGHGRVIAGMRSIEPRWFALCIVSQAVAYVGYVFALRWTARCDDGPRLGFGFTARVVAAGFGAFFSAAAAGGFELDYWALRHSGASRREALSRVIGLGTLEYAVLAPAAMFSAIAMIVGAGKHEYLAVTAPWFAVAPGFVVAAWLTQPARARRWTRTHVHSSRLRHGIGHAISGLTTLRWLAMNPRYGVPAFGGTALYWFGDILCLWASLRAFHADVRIPALIIAYATGYVLTRRSLPAGGIGVAEVALTFALHWLGVPFATALLGVFTYRIFNFWLALFPALAVLPTVRMIRRDIRRTDAELDHA